MQKKRAIISVTNDLTTDQRVDKYQLGDYIENHTPQHIAEKITEMLGNEENRLLWKTNLAKAKQELTWEKEKQVSIKIFSKYA